MNYTKNEKKFIRTNSVETAHKLRYEGYTEITPLNSNVFIFVNDGKRLTFDAEEFDAVYTNILCI